MSKVDNLAINTIRVLAAEAIQKANSGHPGLPIGSAPMAYMLWAENMRHNPQDPSWPNRDRFILSAGHGSMLLYSLLHIFGYKVTADDLQNFRQWGSVTPGHPEYGQTDGVEATSGPLGQGLAMAVGMALAESHLAAEFNREGFPIVDHYTYVLTGEGCLEEGVSGEASSFAGTQKLGKLIVLYDKNDITIEGSIDAAFTENVGERYKAYGWQVLEVEEGNTDLDSIDKAIKAAKAETERPSLIIVKTTIAYSVPNKQGSASSHGAPLGADNIDGMKKALGWTETTPFTVPKEVKEHIRELQDVFTTEENAWKQLLDDYKEKYPDLARKYEEYFKPVNKVLFDETGYWMCEDEPVATRVSSGQVIQKLAANIPNLIGGSADLAPANNSDMKSRQYFSPEDRTGTNIHYGIREFAMAAISNGIALHGGLVPYCATFLVFSDYMKGAMRMSALMHLPVTYVLTHDSIGVGEDGPTHEPIGQLAMLRAIPNLHTWRPADYKETAAAYASAMTCGKPTAIALSRQPLPQQKSTGEPSFRGAYILHDTSEDQPDVIIIATGSEVSLVMDSVKDIEAKGVKVRVVSMPCMELFEEQDDAYKSMVLPDNVRKRLVVEAASSFGWGRYVGLDGAYITIDRFGASAPAKVLFEKFGFTKENVVNTALFLAGK
ncbi:MAG: transketolase [Clostridia bacterium]|nr:transketolase [Clostridia bacterium]